MFKIRDRKNLGSDSILGSDSRFGIDKIQVLEILSFQAVFRCIYQPFVFGMRERVDSHVYNNLFSGS